MSQRRERDLRLSSGLDYKRVPKKRFKKWSNIVCRIKFRELEKLLIECIKRKDTLGKNAQKVYQKYIDKIKGLEQEINDLKEIVAYLEGLLKLSTDLRKKAEADRLADMGTAIGDYLGKVLK